MTYDAPSGPALASSHGPSATQDPSDGVASTLASALHRIDRPRRLRVIFNPTAGGAKGRRLHQTLDALKDLGCTLDLQETRQRGDAERLAAIPSTDSADMLVVAGGDGTVNEAINGLLSLRPQDQMPMGIIPLGTANVLALDMGITLTPRGIAETLARGVAKPVHLAAVPGSGNSADRYFLLMGGAGFDAHVVENVRLGLKRHTGKLAYVVETLWQALRYPFPTVCGSVDGRFFEAATAVVCNGRLYGGPFVAAPDAHLTERTLFLILLKRKGLANVLRYAVGLGRQKLDKMPDVEIIPFSELSFDSPVGGPLQADGDVFAHLPVRVEACSRQIALVWPQTS